MPCLVALLVLSILGIFSASHRKLAREAFDCVFRRVTLRPCNTGFDVKIKAKVLGPLLSRSPKIAKFVNRYFETLAWGFIILMTVSFLWTLQGVYNFWAWGDCQGRYTTGGFCAFDPTGQNTKTTGTTNECKDVAVASKNISLTGLDLSLFPTKITNPGSKSIPEVVFMGCFSCDYTRKAYPLIKDLIQKTPANFTFIHFPVKPETNYLQAYDYCITKEYSQKYFNYVDMMFSLSKDQVTNEATVRGKLEKLNLDLMVIDQCLKDPTTTKAVDTRMSQMLGTGIYGTPTVFINGTPVVGPKPLRVYQRLLKQSLL